MRDSRFSCSLCRTDTVVHGTIMKPSDPWQCLAIYSQRTLRQFGKLRLWKWILKFNSTILIIMISSNFHKSPNGGVFKKKIIITIKCRNTVAPHNKTISTASHHTLMRFWAIFTVIVLMYVSVQSCDHMGKTSKTVERTHTYKAQPPSSNDGVERIWRINNHTRSTLSFNWKMLCRLCCDILNKIFGFWAILSRKMES